MQKPSFDFDEWFNEHSGGTQLRLDKSARDLEDAIQNYGKQCVEYAQYQQQKASEPPCSNCNGTGQLHNSRGYHYGACGCQSDKK